MFSLTPRGEKKEKIVWTSVLFSVTSPKFKPVGPLLPNLSVFLCTSPGVFFCCPIKIKQIADLIKSEEFTTQGCF